jgi:thioredoxin-like negative regulator of GroEL
MTPTVFPSRVRRTLLFVALALLLVPAAIFASAAEEPQVQVERIVRAMERQSLPEVWALAFELESLGEKAVPSIKIVQATSTEAGKLGCAKALLALGEPAEAAEALKGVMGDATDPETRLAAIRLLEAVTGVPSLGPYLVTLLEGTYDPKERIAVAKALWTASGSGKARSQVRQELLSALQSEDEDVRPFRAPVVA